MYIDTERFIKIGITTKTIQERFQFKSVFPYPYDVVFTTTGMLYELFEREQHIKKIYKGSKYIPQHKFNGHSECFVSTITDNMIAMLTSSSSIVFKR